MDDDEDLAFATAVFDGSAGALALIDRPPIVLQHDTAGHITELLELIARLGHLRLLFLLVPRPRPSPKPLAQTPPPRHGRGKGACRACCRGVHGRGGASLS